MKTMFLSLACLCIATCLSAQSITDSLYLEIASIVPGKYNNYDVNISIENRTKEFRYLLIYRALEFCNDTRPCWRVRFEVEYQDGKRDTCQAAGAFFMEDYPVISYQIKIGEQQGLKIALRDIYGSPVYAFAVKKGENQDLLNMFNRGLKSIKDDGTFDKILKRYIE